MLPMVSGRVTPFRSYRHSRTEYEEGGGGAAAVAAEQEREAILQRMKDPSGDFFRDMKLAAIRAAREKEEEAEEQKAIAWKLPSPPSLELGYACCAGPHHLSVHVMQGFIF